MARRLLGAGTVSFLLVGCSGTATVTVTSSGTPSGSGSGGTASSASTAGASATPAPLNVPGGPAITEIVELAEQTHAMRVVTVPGGDTATQATLGDKASLEVGPAGAWVVEGTSVERFGAGATAPQAVGSITATGGGVVGSPDGSAFAYAEQVTTSGQTYDNRLHVVRGGHDTVIAERTVDASSTAAPADAPGSAWAYRVLAWTARGLIVVRLPEGIGGYGPWIGEGAQAHVAEVDPATGSSKAVADDPSCPVSTVAADGSTAVCFHVGGGGGSDDLRLVRAGTPVARFTLSGKARAGGAHLSPDGRTLVYATVDLAALQAGGDFTGQYVTRVLDLASGTAHVIGQPGTDPLGFATDGRLLAQVFGGGGSHFTLLDPASGAATTIGPPLGSDPVDIVTDTGRPD